MTTMTTVFATDIDSTIITTLKPEGFCADPVCISTTPRGSSYMSKKERDKFVKVTQEIPVVPITTRGIVSYSTIDFGVNFEYALLDSGALLLVNNKFDEEWTNESRRIFEDGKALFTEGKQYLESQGFHTKTDSEFVIDYTSKVVTPEKREESFNTLKEMIGDVFDVFKAGTRGIFATHKKLDKGNNIKRFKETYGIKNLITAGDSGADWPMFEHSENSIGLSNSPATIKYDAKKFKENQYNFLSFVVNKLTELI